MFIVQPCRLNTVEFGKTWWEGGREREGGREKKKGREGGKGTEDGRCGKTEKGERLEIVSSKGERDRGREEEIREDME